VHKGTFRAQRKPVSVWVFDKKALMADKNIDKKQKERLIAVLKRGPLELVKLKHPAVLAITYPLAESKESLAFATEPIFSSLANVLGKTDNMDRVPLNVRDFQLLEIEILMGLIQLSAACSFLHQAEMIHGVYLPSRAIPLHPLSNAAARAPWLTPHKIGAASLSCSAGNITPNNIVMNQHGEWRLCGFEFALHSKYVCL
jgi:hypothetical protein